MEVSTPMTLQDYENIKRTHPDLVIGESIGHSITLARVCVACAGNGSAREYIDRYTNKVVAPACMACGGHGYIPTPDGEALLRLFHLFATGGRG